jgi:hypothetical protein
LRLDQQPFSPRVGLDGVDDDAYALGQLIEEGDVSFAEAVGSFIASFCDLSVVFRSQDLTLAEISGGYRALPFSI